VDNEVLYPVTVVLWIGRRTRIGLSSTEGGDTHTTSHLDILHSQHGPCPPGLHVQPMSCKYNCPAKSGWVDGCLEVYSEAKLSQAVQPASQPASQPALFCPVLLVVGCPVRGSALCSRHLFFFAALLRMKARGGKGFMLLLFSRPASMSLSMRRLAISVLSKGPNETTFHPRLASSTRLSPVNPSFIA